MFVKPAMPAHSGNGVLIGLSLQASKQVAV